LVGPAKELGNVIQVWTIIGHSRDSFYRWATWKCWRWNVMGNKPQEVQRIGLGSIVMIAIANPVFGQVRGAKEGVKQRISFSDQFGWDIIYKNFNFF
jgi:hypothetical protein